MSDTLTPTKTFSPLTLKGEITRRKANKTRTPKVKAKSFVLPAMSKPQIQAVLAGQIVEVTFKSDRREVVALAS